MPDISDYFTRLAVYAKTTLRGDARFHDQPDGALLVQDTRQDSQATAWKAVAIHPLQVLETEYQSVVRLAEAAGTDDQQRRDLQHEALSRFFTLSGTASALLKLDIDNVATDLERDALIDDELAALRAQLYLVKALIDQPAPPRTPLEEMGNLVERAVGVIGKMAPGKNPAAMAPGLRKAVDYLGLYTTYSPADAVSTWVRVHQNETDFRGLAAELGENLVTPLSDPANALASARSLYNIRSFYLFRLLHRFHGGSSSAQMNLDAKAAASGLVTKAMHPTTTWPWLADWHEGQIQQLAAKLRALDQKLMQAFNRSEGVLRFFLKGGRAMFTSLGTPEKGTNDWDTGILIDPTLSPKDWYTAFAAVNDIIILALDALRFGYTEVLYQNAEQVADWLPGAALAAARAEPEDEVADFTRLGAQAEEELLRSRAGLVPPAHLLAASPGRLSAHELHSFVNGLPQPVGVNGELIDIGIATRSSIELLELWDHLNIVTRPGVSGREIPVPELGFFLDDFSTIIREAIEDQGPVDQKFSKRLQRLALVLEGADLPLFTERQGKLTQLLPNTMPSIAPVLNTPAGRLQVWTLFNLLMSLEPESPGRGAWVSSLDTYVQGLASGGRLYDESSATVTTLWNQIKDDFSETPDSGAGMLTLLAIQVGTHELANTIIRDFRLRESAFNLPQRLGQSTPASSWKTIEAVLKALPSSSGSGVGPLVVTGTFASWLQVLHAGVDASLVAKAWPVELIEVEQWMSESRLPQSKQLLQQLAIRLNDLGGKVNCTVSGEGENAELVVTPTTGDFDYSGTGAINGSRPTVLVIRPRLVDDDPRASSVTDTINGWLVTSARDLVRQFRARAAKSMDYGIRGLAHASADLLIDEVLGRQI
jgi:hypothetical protein